jgi:hypothetical protein
MRGRRWHLLFQMLAAFLHEYESMKNILVSCLFFNDKAEPSFLHKPIHEVLQQIKLSPCKGIPSDYAGALRAIVNIAATCPKDVDYLTSVFFFSCSGPELPKEQIDELAELQRRTKSLILYTFACENTEDESLRMMATRLKGVHYSVPAMRSLPSVFESIVDHR